jgi:hypothetical protein
MTGFSPGDITVKKFTISSDRGSLDLAKSFVSASIYESIFTPGIIIDIEVLDTDDQIGQLKISGDEKVDITFSVPGGSTATYKLGISNLGEVKGTTSSLKHKTYKISTVSIEALKAKNNYVEKTFSAQISDIIKTIHKDYLQSSKKIEVEETKGKQDIKISHKNPYEAIEIAMKRAVSNENKSSLFVFFETRSGSEQIFKFTTIEKLFKGSSVKTFKQSDSINSSMDNKTDDQIFGVETPNQFNAVDRIAIGGQVKVATFNFRTWEYTTNTLTKNSKDYKTGGGGDLNTGKFTQEYREAQGQAKPRLLLVPVDTSQRAKTSIPTYIADKQNFAATLMQGTVKLRVPGDLKLKAGDVITANLPTRKGTTDNTKNDPSLSGKFLISRIHHDIGKPEEKPRYTCVIELLKGNPESAK